MKNFTRFLSLFIALFFAINSFAAFVTKTEAELVAKNFFYKRINLNATYDYSKIQLLNTLEERSGQNTAFYIVNFNPKGFVIVSAEDLALPILGYSIESNFVYNTNMPPALLEAFSNYKAQIDAIRSGLYNNDANIRTQWEKLRSPDFVQNKESFEVRAIVDPLLSTIWNQDYPYNEQCPADAAGPGGHVYAGCVAVSMGQVMKYWNYPNQGNSSSSYYSSYGLLSANYGQTTYDWTQMLNSISTSNFQIARLLYHCGVSVQMNYSPNGSGSQIAYASSALKNYFRYSTASFKQKTSYSTSDWHNYLKTDLNNKKPMIYAGFTTSSAGHAFNFDGYDEVSGTTYYHVNWGWSGMYNGNFTIDNLNSGNGDFTTGQQVVHNIYPGSDYPYSCGPTKTLTGLKGTFEDGSGIMDYQNNLNCSWLFVPADSVTKITFTVDEIDTETDDEVKIYDGTSTSANLLATISGTTPPTSSISTTGNRAYVTFTTNGSGVKSGWKISWTAHEATLCSGTVTFTDANGTFTDGSANWEYNNNSNCKWYIKPANAATVTLSFSQFNVDPDNDYVKIYDKNGTGATVLATYTGNTIPPSVTSDKGEMLIMFRSNANVTAQGFTAHWTSTQAGVEEIQANALSIYPNPAKNTLYIATGISIKEKFTVNIINSLGQLVKTASYTDVANGVILFDISDLNDGMYFLNLRDNKNNITKKFHIVK